jgi:probable HAF family extracellular repeat protein
MKDLGSLSEGGWSEAHGANADGSVVVGWSQTKDGWHAFRWGNGDMEDLGTLPGHTWSQALGVNADGSVVVGWSGTGPYTEPRAFRWENGDMRDLGTLPGDTSSQAYGVNADGSVVVGVSEKAGFGRAFRWTEKTGMRDLNELLKDAGVNMTGIVLQQAQAVSDNGHFIVGQGKFPEGTRAYIVRYDDGTTAGLTTTDKLKISIDQLAETRAGLLAQHHGFAAPLLGTDKPMTSGNEAGVFVSGGSVAGGGFLRYGLGQGLALLGGISYAKESYPDADLDGGFTGALAVQYLHTLSGWWHPFVELGGWVAPEAELSFSRTYANGAGTATGTGHTHGDLSYLYARAGILFTVSDGDQIALSAEIGRQRMAVEGYSEGVDGNPFEAHVFPGTDRADIVKARLQWSHRFTDDLDATVWAAAVQAFNHESGLRGKVWGIGTFVPASLDELTWAEYGARVGYKVTDVMTLDLFMTGVSGDSGIGTHVHAGAGLRFQF